MKKGGSIIPALFGPDPKVSEGGLMPLPALSEEQRRQALAKAAEVRKKRAALKQQLKTEQLSLRDVISRRSNDDAISKMKVSAVLEALPGVGKVRARKIMERLDISSSRRVRGLGAKQRRALLTEFPKG